MLTESTDGSLAALERLSALADGELDEGGIGQACHGWRGDGRLRSSWHAYHLIGDVLRSSDLAADPARDALFLAGLRSRLADEPVVLAPAPLPPPSVSRSGRGVNGGAAEASRRRRSWMMSSSIAAGFVAVAGVVFVTRTPDAGPVFASASVPATARQALAVDTSIGRQPPAAVAAATTDPQALVASGKLIRDVRLDRYLSAHKEFAGSSALGVPSGFLRNATADASDR